MTEIAPSSDLLTNLASTFMFESHCHYVRFLVQGSRPKMYAWLAFGSKVDLLLNVLSLIYFKIYSKHPI